MVTSLVFPHPTPTPLSQQALDFCDLGQADSTLAQSGM